MKYSDDLATQSSIWFTKNKNRLIVKCFVPRKTENYAEDFFVAQRKLARRLLLTLINTNNIWMNV